MPKKTLTDRTVKALKPPKKGQVSYWDASLSNFGVRVSQGGTKSFVVLSGRGGKRTTIGRYPEVSLKEAREEAKRVLAEKTLGKHRPKRITFDDALKEFLAFKEATTRPRTATSYREIFRRHLKFGRAYLDEITTDDIHRKIARLSDRPATQNYAFAVTRMFFRWALTRNYVERQPLNGPRPARTKSRDRVLTDDELREVYLTTKEGTGLFDFIVQLLILTGQRRSEIAALEWHWIDTDAQTITLPAAACKNNREHTFPYGDLVAGVLDRIPQTSDTYVFPAARKSSRGTGSTVFNGWAGTKARLDARLGNVGPWVLHDLRRTFATKHAELGTPIHVTEKLLNHVSGSHGGMVAIYQRHSWLPEMRNAIENYDSFMKKLDDREELDRNASFSGDPEE